MPSSQQPSSIRSQRRRRPPRAGILALAAALGLGVWLAAIALASSGPATLDSSASSALGETVVVSAQGRTLYALSPETAGHLLCRSNECLKAWPPLTVPSRSTKLKAGTGVHGRLGLVHRSNGILQVTLRGLPLYRFSGDRAKGEANGQGIQSFGGTWHAVTASTSATPATPATPSAPAGAGTPPVDTTPTPPTAPAAPSTPSTTPTSTSPPSWGY